MKKILAALAVGLGLAVGLPVAANATTVRHAPQVVRHIYAVDLVRNGHVIAQEGPYHTYGQAVAAKAAFDRLHLFGFKAVIVGG